MQALLGGPARTRVVLLLSGVLALSSADLGAVGAVAGQLQTGLGLNHTQLGLLATVSTGAGALAAIPVGAFADRAARVWLLMFTVVVWSVALAVGGAARSYPWLLLSRPALGGAAAASGPLLASLMGDLFPTGERAKVYGWVLTGEMIGAGVGLLAGVGLAARAVLAVGILAARLPGTGIGAGAVPDAARTRPRWCQPPAPGGGTSAAEPAGTPAWTMRRERSQPRASESLLAAMRYVLKIPTVRVLIVASAVGYFFFAGLRTFAIVFVERRFGIGPAQVVALVPIIGAGALAGVLLGGRVADALVTRGRRDARVVVPAVACTAAAVLVAPGLLISSLWLALPLFVVATGMLAAANPPLDAARLDLVRSGMWGRAEAARTVLRLAAEAVAPLTYGITADLLGGPGARGSAPGLRDTFLIMLIPLLANGVIVYVGRRTYSADVAAAADDSGRFAPSRGG